MATGHLVSDELVLPDLPAESSRPMDSSAVLLELMALARRAKEAQNNPDDMLEGVISKSILRSLLGALHFRDMATVRHVRRVAMLAVGMAKYLGWDGRHLRLMEIAGLLHDIGKIGVPDNVLFKPGALSPEEASLMALHRNIGIDVLQACHVDREVLEIIGQSHTFYNSSRNGLRRAGTEDHQGARILAVADAYDSLATEQVYRAAKPHDEIMQILAESSGTQFDGNIVAALARWSESEGVPFQGNPATVGTGDGPRGPAHPEEALEANSLCNILSYLYLLESLYDGFFLVDADRQFVVWNPEAEQLLGYPAREMLGRTWTSHLLCYADEDSQPLGEGQYPVAQVMQSRKSATTKVHIEHWDGAWISVEVQSVPLVDREGRLQGVAEIFRDLARTGQKPHEYHDLKLAASRDSLTMVANRGELESQLKNMLAEFSEEPNGDPFSVIFLDIDHFKEINDTHGHTAGDEVLIEVARVLQNETYSGELVGRYGGEEFVIICPATPLSQAAKRADRLRLVICNARLTEIEGVTVTASFGITEVEAGDTIDSLIRRADKALYLAKDAGRNATWTLTAEQLHTLQTESGEIDPHMTNPLEYQGTFQACIAADMIVYKLGGFVTDNDAKLREVSPKRTVIQVGSRGVLPFWGGSDDRRPVVLEVEIGDEQKPPANSKRGASARVEIHVRIRPIGWVRDTTAFQYRAKRVMKDLRSYFAAE